MGSMLSRNNKTAVSVQKSNLDNSSNPAPRSPTVSRRTPLQNKNVGKHNITRNVDLRNTLESTERGEGIVIDNHSHFYDVRSPTQDFEQTPVVLPTKLNNYEFDYGSPFFVNSNIGYNDFCSYIKNKCTNIFLPKNLCHNCMSLCDTFIKPNILLCSSTVVNESVENNMSNNNVKEPTVLLKTNLGYVENNNDEFEDYAQNISQINYDVEEMEHIHQISFFKTFIEDPCSTPTGIATLTLGTPIAVFAKHEAINEIDVEKMSDDTLIKALQNTNDELQESCKPSDYKENVLIYEDGSQQIQYTPKNSILLGCPRTPLLCMKNRTKSNLSRTTTFYDSKTQVNTFKPRTSRVSQIPRLKSLSKTKSLSTGSGILLKNISKVSVIQEDCENLPPP